MASTSQLEVVFQNGTMESIGCVNIDIIDDLIIEGAEVFTVNITDAGSATIGSPFTSYITITDNDSEL